MSLEPISLSRLKAVQAPSVPRGQRGITTLVVAILLLVLLATAIVFSANVGLFEQRTTTSENRARIAQQASEGALNLATEFVKANSSLITSEATGGWLNGASSVKWTPCSSVTSESDSAYWICQSETNATRRAASRVIGSLSLTSLLSSTASGGLVDQEIVTRAALSTSAFDAASGQKVATNTKVGAILCQVDPALAGNTNPCSLNPASGGATVVTLVSCTSLSSVGEAAPSGFDPCWGGSDSATQKQFFATDEQTAVAISRSTLATYRSIGDGAKAPLIASGTVSGLGSMEIVTAPNGGGTGIPVSVWTPCPVDIEAGSTVSTDALCPAASGGIGSVITCHLGDFLGTMPAEKLLDTSTGCASSTNACGCPNDLDRSLSGSAAGSTREGVDILDIDGNAGALPDITYFPREPYDTATDNYDDSMFEVLFRADVVAEGTTSVRQNCGTPATQDCARYALSQKRNIKQVDDCDDIPGSTGGFYWVQNTGQCDLPDQVGTPTEPVVIVIEGGSGTVQLQGSSIAFGMIYVRSSTNAAVLTGGSNAWFLYGALVVEGRVNMTGLNLVYSEEVIQRISDSPTFQTFGVVPGSWLDARTSL